MDDRYFDTPKAAAAPADEGSESRRQRVLAAVLLGQLLSFLLAVSGTISSLLVKKGVSLPASQTVPNYALLALVYGSVLLAKRIRPVNAWTSYAGVALLDVEGNFLVVLAFRYTFLTSIQLLNSFTVPCVFILSWAFLRARYRPLHCFGAILCVGSLALLVLTDGRVPQLDQQKPLLGDFLVLLGALAYACCNIAQEKLLRKSAVVEVLALMGAFGLLWSAIQAAALEGKQLLAMTWTPEVVALLAGYTGSLFAFYSLVPSVLNWSGAATLNLSLLSSNLWAALARTLFLGGFPLSSATAFAAALVLAAAGLALYACGGSVYTAAASEDCYRVIRCSNLEETPRAGGHSSSVFDGKRCVLDAFKKGRLGDGGGGNVASGVRTPSSSSSLQVSGGDVETPSPRVPSTPADSPAARGGGGSTNRVTFSTLFRGTWGSLMPKHPAAAGAAAGDFAGSAVAGGGSKGGSPRGELAFRIWSLPNEGAITTDPYTRVGGTIERNESKPPSRPS